MKRILKIVSVVLVLVLLVVFVANKWVLPAVASRFLKIEASYIEYPLETMMSEADMIFQGQVVEISQTRWNQDSGEYWDGGLPYHEIVLAVGQPIVGDVQDQAKVTVLGNAPLDDQVVLEGGHSLQVGDELVVFARQTELAWRESERVPALMFMGSPESSMLTQKEDGLFYAIDGQFFSLVELVAQIQQKRTAP